MIRQNWLAIVLGIGILLVMTAAAYLKSEEEKGDGNPSSYSTLRRGGKAAYLLLQQSGYPVERWQHSPKDLPADGHGILLVIGEPVSHPTTEESNALTRFLLHGGSILAAGMYPDAFVPKAAAANGKARIGATECKAVAPTRLTRGGSVSIDGDLKWDSTDSSQLVHFADENGNAVVVSYSAGNGSVTWWASAWPLSNAGIREKNNLELLLNSTAGYKRILWDEYYQDEHHQSGEHKPVKAYSWAMAQLALIGLAIVLTYSRRSGPLVPLVQESRLSPWNSSKLWAVSFAVHAAPTLRWRLPSSASARWLHDAWASAELPMLPKLSMPCRIAVFVFRSRPRTWFAKVSLLPTTPHSQKKPQSLMFEL